MTDIKVKSPCLSVRTSVHACVCMSVWPYVHTTVCPYVSMSVDAYSITSVSPYVCTWMFLCFYVCISVVTQEPCASDVTVSVMWSTNKIPVLVRPYIFTYMRPSVRMLVYLYLCMSVRPHIRTSVRPCSRGCACQYFRSSIRPYVCIALFRGDVTVE